MRIWTVTRLPKNRLGIQCAKCKNKATVSRKWLRSEHDKKGKPKTRPCTYCFWTGIVPRPKEWLDAS